LKKSTEKDFSSRFYPDLTKTSESRRIKQLAGTPNLISPIPAITL
jgi:hypothetical protein